MDASIVASIARKPRRRCYLVTRPRRRCQPMPLFPVVASVASILLEGEDARRFAQAQFSGDVEQLAPGHWQWNAWLNPQGRVQALMQLADPGDGRLVAVLRGGDAGAIRAGLTRYLLRSWTTLRVQRYSVRAGEPLPIGDLGCDGDRLVLGCGRRSAVLDPELANPADCCDAVDWRRADIRAGWPTLPCTGRPRFLPQALGLEGLGALSFRKGCFPGQEIAARLHHRGTCKYRLVRLCGRAPLAPGEARDTDGVLKAFILDAVTVPEVCEALAVVSASIDREINIMGNIYRIAVRQEP